MLPLTQIFERKILIDEIIKDCCLKIYEILDTLCRALKVRFGCLHRDGRGDFEVLKFAIADPIKLLFFANKEIFIFLLLSWVILISIIFFLYVKKHSN